MNRTVFRSTLAMLAAVALPALATAQSAPKSAAKPAASLTGTWNISLIGDHVIPLGLDIVQDGTGITGTLNLMGKDLPVKGELVAGHLVIATTDKLSMNHAPPAPGAPATAGPEPAPLKFVGDVKDDGSLAGEVAAMGGVMKWSAERLKVRPTAPASAPANATPLAIAGDWALTATGEHVVPMGLQLTQKDAKVTGTITLMGAEIAVSGDYASGALSVSGELTADAAAKAGMAGMGGAVKLTARMKKDGTLDGTFTMTHGVFPVTGERQAKR